MIMTKEEKDSLYEAIMRELSPIVKNKISQISDASTEMFYKEFQELDNKLEKLYEHFNYKMSHLTQEQIGNMTKDFFSRYQSIRHTFPKYSVNEIFNSQIEFEHSFEQIKDKLKTATGLKEWQIELVDFFSHNEPIAFIKQQAPQNLIATVIPIINDNILFINEFMEKNGYYLIRHFHGKDVISLNDPYQKEAYMVTLLFVQKITADISRDVHTCDYLYHIVPEKHMASIRKHGLIPKARTNIFDIRLKDAIHYPERIYFFCGKSPLLALHYAKDSMPSGTYRLLRVKTSNINPELPIYCDPLIKDNAVYVEFNIPYNFIEELDEFVI